MRIPFFRIFYSTTFTILSLVLFVLVLITPTNLVYEAFRRKEIYDIFIISGVFVLTLIVAVLLYASRLYNNRRNLVHIPSEWSPLDAEKKVRRLVEEKLEYAAGVAYRCKPRDLSKDVVDNKDAPTRSNQPTLQTSNNTQPPPLREEDVAVAVPPPWGIISHPGWSSPSSPDLPDIQFETIIRELPNLIEAKAVSLAPPALSAPPSPASPSPPTPPQTHPPSSSAPPPSPSPSPSPDPDPDLLSLLQRPAPMGLRDYVTHLSALGMLSSPHPQSPSSPHPYPPLISNFLQLYEQARFSGEPLAEGGFRELMGMFAEILRGMRGVYPASSYPSSSSSSSSSSSASSVGVSGGGEGGGAGGGARGGSGGGDGEERLRTSFESDGSGATVMYTPLPPPSPSPLYYERNRDRDWERRGSEGSARTAPEQRPRSLVSRASEGSVVRVEGVRGVLDLPFLDV